jgi:hypothetical protein
MFSSFSIGDRFLSPTAECESGTPLPYLLRVLRAHRDGGFWECVVESGGHRARHGSILVVGTREVAEGVRHHKQEG